MQSLIQKNLKMNLQIWFLELINKYDEIYYLDNLDFLLNQKILIVAIPFFNTFLMTNIVKKSLKLSWIEYKRVNIITISNSEKIWDQK